MDGALGILWISAAVASAATLVVYSDLGQGLTSGVTTVWLARLLSCHFCLGHWLALPLVLYYQPVVLLPAAGWLATTVGLMVSWLAVVAVSSMMVRLITGARGAD